MAAIPSEEKTSVLHSAMPFMIFFAGCILLAGLMGRALEIQGPSLTISEATPTIFSYAAAVAAGSMLIYAVVLIAKKIRFSAKNSKLIVILVVSALYGITLLAYISYFLPWQAAVVISAVYCISFVLTASFIPKFLPPFTLITSAIVGISIVSVLPFLVIIGLVLAMSVYDVISVFVGPLRFLFKFLKTTKRQSGLQIFRESGLATTFGKRSVGLGDSIFYTALVIATTLHSNAISGGLAFTGILAGFVLTFWLLDKKKGRPLPALPLPIILGIVLSLA